MKKSIHPKYQKVLFVDSATGRQYLIGSTVQSKETETFQGKEYPVVRVSISSSSHPFFVGGKQFVDTEGRVDKFTKRYQMAQQKAQESAAEQEKKKQEQEEASAKPKKKAAKKA
jgi:large subunit ribosomal protein L31